MLDNSLEYPLVWIGLSKIGCITALINSNLRATPLLHSVRTVHAKGIITSQQFLPGKYFLFFFKMKIFTFYFIFLIEIESELKELNLNKIYLFDPKHNNKTSNGHTSNSPFDTIHLYERLEQCSTQPTKPIPFDLKRNLK